MMTFLSARGIWNWSATIQRLKNGTPASSSRPTQMMSKPLAREFEAHLATSFWKFSLKKHPHPTSLWRCLSSRVSNQKILSRDNRYKPPRRAIVCRGQIQTLCSPAIFNIGLSPSHDTLNTELLLFRRGNCHRGNPLYQSHYRLSKHMLEEAEYMSLSRGRLDIQ